MIELGIGTKVENYEELRDWFAGLRDNMPELERVHTAASRYVQGKCRCHCRNRLPG